MGDFIIIMHYGSKYILAPFHPNPDFDILDSLLINALGQDRDSDPLRTRGSLDSVPVDESPLDELNIVEQDELLHFGHFMEKLI